MLDNNKIQMPPLWGFSDSLKKYKEHSEAFKKIIDVSRCSKNLYKFSNGLELNMYV